MIGVTTEHVGEAVDLLKMFRDDLPDGCHEDIDTLCSDYREAAAAGTVDVTGFVGRVDDICESVGLPRIFADA